jgi:hypothetical protein
MLGRLYLKTRLAIIKVAQRLLNSGILGCADLFLILSFACQAIRISLLMFGHSSLVIFVFLAISPAIFITYHSFASPS